MHNAPAIRHEDAPPDLRHRHLSFSPGPPHGCDSNRMTLPATPYLYPMLPGIVLLIIASCKGHASRVSWLLTRRVALSESNLPWEV